MITDTSPRLQRPSYSFIFCKLLQELQVQINSEDMTELQVFLEILSFLPTETLS